MKNILISLSLISLVSCADGLNHDVDFTETRDSSGIFGGLDAGIDSKLSNQIISVITLDLKTSKWDASTGSYTKGYNQCSGVALSKRVILSAAHCAHGVNPVHIEVPDENDHVEKIRVSSRKLHEAYRLGFWDFDIALLQLEKDLPSNIEIHKLPSYRNHVKPSFVNAAGFGKTDGRLSSSIGAGSLRIVTLRVQDYTDRSRALRLEQSNGKGFCQGDSGGPLIAYSKGNKYIVGVISRVSGKESSKNPDRNVCDEYGYAVKTDSNLPWLHKHLSILNTGQLVRMNKLETIADMVLGDVD